MIQICGDILKYSMKTILSIIFLTLLNVKSFSQRQITKDEMRMVENIKHYEKENVKKVYKRRDGYVVLIFPSSKYVTDNKYVQHVYIRKNARWVELSTINQEYGQH
jgi:hypothetical protein